MKASWGQLLCQSLLAFLLSAWAMLGGPLANATTPYEPHFRLEVLQQLVRHGGALTWPPNNGYANNPHRVVLQPGTLIDQFIISGGDFFYAAGTPYSKRALPYVCDEMSYRIYRILVLLSVVAGRVAPWFGSPGGGEQYKANATAESLLRDSKISLEAESSPFSKSASRPCE